MTNQIWLQKIREYSKSVRTTKIVSIFSETYEIKRCLFCLWLLQNDDFKSATPLSKSRQGSKDGGHEEGTRPKLSHGIWSRMRIVVMEIVTSW